MPVSVARALMVGVAGFEPAAFRSQSGRATKLRHTPCAVARGPPRTPRDGGRISERATAGIRLTPRNPALDGGVARV